MKTRALVLLSLTLVVTTIPLAAQTQTCSATTYTNTLICTLPQLFGPQGLTLPNFGHDAHFAGSSESTYLPLNQGIGQALSILPLGSSGSGTTWAPDSAGHMLPSQDSLGPILTERASVIGKKAFSLGVAYQYFNFTKIDGLNLHSFPAVLTHEGWTPELAVGPNVFKQDYIQTSNQVNLDLNQTVIYAVIGIAKRMDASIELPIQAAHLRVISVANIVRTQPCEFAQNCSAIDPKTGKDEATCGEFHYFQGDQSNCPLIFSSVNATFPYKGAPGLITVQGSSTPVLAPRRSGPPMEDATGIGDVILRGKYEVINREKLTGSIGLGIRFPSGDANNFLGTGAYGVTPFGVLTYARRFSPHVRFGYQWNSHSLLAGDPSGITGPSTGSLPPAWLYSGGADYRVKKWLTVAADLIGQAVPGVRRLSLGSYSLLPAIKGLTPPTASDKTTVPSILISTGTSSYNSDAIAVGGKIRLKGELLLVGNATIRVDDGGLRANVVPLVGLSWSK
jgi:hypothetical protein